jgi:predicted P-loop ATPase/GTPase
MTERSAEHVRTVDQVVRADRLIVVVPVEVVVVDGEECFKPSTLEFLAEVERRARADDLPWLLRHGRVYQLLPTSKAG